MQIFSIFNSICNMQKPHARKVERGGCCILWNECINFYFFKTPWFSSEVWLHLYICNEMISSFYNRFFICFPYFLLLSQLHISYPLSWPSIKAQNKQTKHLIYYIHSIHYSHSLIFLLSFFFAYIFLFDCKTFKLHEQSTVEYLFIANLDMINWVK